MNPVTQGNIKEAVSAENSSSTPLQPHKDLLSNNAMETKATPQDLEQSQKKIEEKRFFGFKIPDILVKIYDIFEKTTKFAVSAIGIPLKYVGVFLVVAGGIHFLIVLFTTPIAAPISATLINLVFAFIKSGALPTIIAGAVMYRFGNDLIKNEKIDALGLIPWILPLPFYTMLQNSMPLNPIEPPK